MQREKAPAGWISGYGFAVFCTGLMLAAGCEPYSTLSTNETEGQAPAPAATSTAPAQTPAPGTETAGTASGDTSTNDVAPVVNNRFIWDPGAGSVRLVIPYDIPHWLLHISTTSPSVNHQIGLYGPDRTGGRATINGFEYTLKGGGAQWRNDALAIDPKGGGAVVVFINTNNMQPSGYRTSHWIVPDPRQYYTGNPQKL